MPKFDITVKLIGTDGNAFALLGKVQRSLRGVATQEQVNEFMEEAMSDYNHLLRTCTEWVNVK